MRVQGGFDEVPYLNLRKDETGLPMFPNVRGHEGRHRSRALAGMGESSSLVNIQPSGGLREELPRRSREEFIEALRKELDLKDRMVIGEDNINVLRLPDVYAEGGEVGMQAGGVAKLLKGLKGTQEVLPAAQREANLQRMLEGSKVPETLYHGTGSDISGFRPNTFFSDDPRIAGMYAKSKERAVEGVGPNIVPVKARFENPYVYDENQSRKQGKNFFQLIAPDAPAKGRLDEALRILRERGHDSVILKNYADIGGLQTQYIALDPSKVKSAIGNRGTYDMTDPDITKAAGGDVHMDEGGAAFGFFPQMKPRRAKQDREAAKNVPVDLARGFVSGVLGAPGDIESFARLPYELITGNESPTFLPTSEDIEKRLPFRSEAPVSRAASGAGQLAGGFYLGPGSPLRAVGALPGAIKHGAQEFAMASTKGIPKMFIGPKAKTWDQAKADAAARLEKQGVDPVEIWRQTGTFRGADGIPRQEISDAGAVFRNPSDLKELGKQKKQEALDLGMRMITPIGQKDMFPKALTEAKKPVREEIKRLKEEADELGRYSDVRGQRAKFVYDHPELYKAYPELGEVTVYQGGTGTMGERASVRGAGGDMQMEITQKGLRGNPKSSVLHEMQHGVQSLEGMAPGGNTVTAFQNPEAHKILDDLRKAARTPMSFDDFVKKGGYSDDPETLARAMDEYKDYADDVPLLAKQYDRDYQQRAAEEYYTRLAGEAEARATQAREPMSASQRSKEVPYSSYDVLPEDLIVKDAKMAGGGAAFGIYPKQRATPSSEETKKAVKQASQVGVDLLLPQDAVDVGMMLVPGGKIARKAGAALIAGGASTDTEAGVMKEVLKKLLKPGADTAAQEVTAAERAAAGRKAAELIKSQPPVKASEALGQAMEKGFKKTTTTQADRTRVGGGNIGGAPFSAISEVDPAYAGKVWGVMDEGTAARLKNLTDPETAWTTMLGSANQLKTNPIVFDKLKKGFLESMKAGNLSPELEAKINQNLGVILGEGSVIRDPKMWRQIDTFEKRAAVADLMMGQGLPPKKGGSALGGEKSGKGVIFKPTDTFIRETEPYLLHPEHGGSAPTFAAGPRLFSMDPVSEFRPDLHPGFPTLISGKDLGYNMIPTPTEVYLPDWHKAFKQKKPERFQGPWAEDILQRRKDGGYKLKGAEGPGYYDLALGLEGEGLPSQALNDAYIRYLIREGFKAGGTVSGLSTVNKLCGCHD